MAFFDVNQAIDKPNMLASLQQGYQFGTQQRLQREQEGRENQLRTLAPKVIDGDPDAYNQAAAIDPRAAQGYQEAGDVQLRRLQGFYRYVEEARASGNPARVSAALRAGAPFLAKLVPGKAPPTEWTPDLDEGWAQLGAKLSMLPGEQGRDGKVVGNSLIDPQTGRVIYQGPEVPVNAQLVDIPDGRGGAQKMMFDPRTRQVMPLPAPSNGQPMPASTTLPASNGQTSAGTGPLQEPSIEQAIARLEQTEGPLPENVKAQLRQQMASGNGDFTVANPGLGGNQTAQSNLPQQPSSSQFGYTPPKGPPVPSGYQMAPDGSRLIPMPGGPADKPDGGLVVTLTPAEVNQAGFPAGSVVQRKPDGTLVKTFSPTERDANGGRALPANVVNDLSKDAEKLTTITDLVGSFKPEFAGNVAGGTLENMAGRLGGERLGLATQGQADWWQQYDRLKNVVRNELFGAALTATEQAAFEAADITPNMDPTIVANNLGKQGEIVRRALDRKASVWKSQGYNPDAVINATTVRDGSRTPQDLSDDELLRELGL
ncbi:MAG: hypothetical protein K0M70_02950 [Arenimonas sp.]|uniref:hypothetical protein n=1 Tax=Arenimonas sp. TaxID=1872635 RepID=UPI0025C5F66C|nr:hypothetical protein [Arenimonas sp.]MBW8366800.1 hypothetical protein [Arenimonas sp.]